MITFPRIFCLDLLDPLLFLFFVTLHADQLSWTLLGYQFRLNNLIALLLAAALFCRFPASFFRLDRSLFVSLLAILVSMTLSCIFSPYPERSLFFLIFYGFIVICYIYLPYFTITQLGEKKVIFLYLASFLFVGMYGLCQLLFSFVGIHDPFAKQEMFGAYFRPNAWAYEPSFYALYFTPFVMMTNLYYLLSNSFSAYKIFLVNILFLVSTSTSTVFAYLAFFLCVILFSPILKQHSPFFFKKLIESFLFFAITLMASTLFFPKLVREFYLKFFYGGIGHHSIYERMVGIKNAFLVFLDHPFLGVGMGGYPPYLMKAYLQAEERYTFFFNEKKMSFYAPLKFFEPSNVATEILASLGVIGFLAFSFFLIAFIKKGIIALQKNSENALWILLFLISSLVLLVVLQINQGLFRTYVWCHLAMAYGFFQQKHHYA